MKCAFRAILLLLCAVLVNAIWLEEDKDLRANDADYKKEKQAHNFKRKQRCCSLGRRMAKIGESCEYATTMALILPNKQHYHRMKTSVWMKDRHPIKLRRLQKCKRYKAYYQKCCVDESRQIDQDIKRMKTKVELSKLQIAKRLLKKKAKLRSKSKRRFYKAIK